MKNTIKKILSEKSYLKDIVKKGISKWFPANQLPEGFINKVKLKSTWIFIVIIFYILY